MPKKFIPTQQQLNKINKLANEGKAMTHIAEEMCLDRSVIKRMLTEYNIELKPSSMNKKGKKFEWTSTKLRELKAMYKSEDFDLNDITEYFQISESTIVKKAKELKLNKTNKRFFSKEEEKWLKEHSEEYTLKELSEKLGKNNWVIGKFLTSIGILKRKGKSGGGSVCCMPQTDEFKEDIKNPAYSHTYLARKYKVSDCTIRNWRKKLFGDFKTMVNTYLCKTSLELDFENILNELNLVFEYNKKIDNWTIDYYLGLKICIEMNGEYWHGDLNKNNQHAKITKTMQKDKNKKEFLINNGYTILYFNENDLKDVEKVKEEIVKIMGLPMKKFIEKKPSEPQQ